jgi:SNF2 family DNA or RNA helicase
MLIEFLYEFLYHLLVKQEQRPIASWSPNFDKVKSKVKELAQDREQQQRKIQVIDLDDEENQAIAKKESDLAKLDYKDLKLDAKVIRGPNQQITNRNLSYEDSLKMLREEIFEVLKRKPDRDESYEHLEKHKNLKVSLLPHQCYSMAWFKWRERNYPNGGILADDMGLGKTLTVLAYLNMCKNNEKEKAKNEGNGDQEDEEEEFNSRKMNFAKKHSSQKEAKPRLRTLIIVPASLILQWENEIKSKFTENTFKYYIYHGDNRKRTAYNLGDYDIVFSTYEIVSREIELIEGVPNDSQLARIKWKRIILDEAHRIKNHTTKANKTACLLKAKYRFALTGTPIHNSINDLYSLVKFLQFDPLSEFGLWGYIFAAEKFKGKTKQQSANAVEREKRLGSWLIFLSDYLILRRTKNDTFKGNYLLKK